MNIVLSVLQRYPEETVTIDVDLEGDIWPAIKISGTIAQGILIAGKRPVNSSSS
jgi:hypothetical protein